MPKLLCIGGVRDGEWLATNDELMRYATPIEKFPRWGETMPETVVVSLYHKTALGLGYGASAFCVDVWLEEHTSPGEAIRKLLFGYKPEKASAA